MQIKKFEAPSIQEALEHVKRELGPEAIILKTKNNKRAFGLMSKASVEITAAVSERSMNKKIQMNTRYTEEQKQTIQNLSAKKQAEIFDKYLDKSVTQASRVAEKVEFSPPSKKLTATRYIDIADDPGVKPKALPPIQKAPVISATPALPTSSAELETEVKSLRKMMTELLENIQNSDRKSSLMGSDLMANPHVQDAFEQLVLNGVDRKYAFRLIKKVVFELGNDVSRTADQVLDCLAKEIMESVPIVSFFSKAEQEGLSMDLSSDGPHFIALVGPTGVGKTTTVAKLASLFKSKQNLKVGLINLDQDKPHAFDQLGTYAKVLNLPFRSPGSMDDFSSAILDFAKMDVILIDTAGRSMKEAAFVKNPDHILKGFSGLKSFLVLSATTRDQELYELIRRFSEFDLKGIIMSKLDEASMYGSIFNVSQRSGLPLVSFTTGQKIPEDIEPASLERVAALVMDL